MGVEMTASVARGKSQKIGHFLFSEQKSLQYYIKLTEELKVTKESGSTASIGFELIILFISKGVKLTPSVFVELLNYF